MLRSVSAHLVSSPVSSSHSEVSFDARFGAVSHGYGHGIGRAPDMSMIQKLALLGLPNAQARAVAVLALFVIVQIADGLLTVVGVERFGMAAEANPMVALSMILFGPAIALIAAKGIAIGGAVMLYRLSRHALLALLTLMYVVVAVVPWAWALTVA
jgi:hypothetical protein